LPNGLIGSINRTIGPDIGDITIVGVGTVPRASTTYTLFARSDANQTSSNTFQLQVAPARFQFSNVSGTVVSDSNVRATLSYKQSNDIRIGCRPTPSSINVGVVPIGMTVSLVGSNIVLSGTPTVFFDPSFSTTITAVGIFATTRLNVSLGMQPFLDIVVSPTVQIFCNILYTASNPMVTASVRGYPIACNSFLLGIGNGLTVNQTGAIFGTLSSNTLATIDASGYNTLSNRAQVQFNIVQDVVTFNSAPVNYSVLQNTSFQSSFSARSDSGQPITYTVFPLLDGPVGLTMNTSTGIISGIPRGVSTQSNYKIIATTPFGATASFSISIVTIPDQIDISYSYGLGQYCSPSTSNLSLIQGYPILSNDYSANTLNLLSTTRSGDPISAYLQVSFPSGVTLQQDGTMVGTPLVSGNVSGTFVVKSLNGITALGKVQFSITPDALFLTSPTIVDFVTVPNITQIYTLSGYALSKSRITSFGVSSLPGGITMSVTGQQLTIFGGEGAWYSGRSFNITATTDKGVVITTSATVTQNGSEYSGRFISPSIGQSIILPFGSSFPILTNPTGGTLTSVGSSDVGISGSNLIRLSTSPIYPPQLVVIKAGGFSQLPIRVSTRELSPFIVGGTRWTQYVPIDTITLSASSTSRVIFTVPNPPNGILWNPITSSLTSSPCNLTIRDSFTAYATDGSTTKSFTIPYSVAAPVYLRIFSAPSAYTNYVKQRAFINAAVHSIDNTAFLPDELITSQTGPYPVDVTKDRICLTRRIDTAVTNNTTPTPVATSGPGLSMNPFWLYQNTFTVVISSTISSVTFGPASNDLYRSFANFYPNFSCTFPTYPNNIILAIEIATFSSPGVFIDSNGTFDSFYGGFSPLTSQRSIALSGSNLIFVSTNDVVYCLDRGNIIGVSPGNGTLPGKILLYRNQDYIPRTTTFQNPLLTDNIGVFALEYQMFDTPGGNWSTQFTPCNSISMIGSGTRTTFSYMQTKTLHNSTITAQIVNSNVSGSIGLLPVTSSERFPTTEMTLSYGVVFDGNTSTAYANTNGILTSLGAYSNLDQYAASFTRESFSAFRNGVSVFSVSIGGIGDQGARGGIRLSGNGSSFSPVYFGSTEVIQYQRTPGQFDRWVTANSFIEKKITETNSAPLLVNSLYSNTLFNFTVKSMSSDAVFTVTGPSSPNYIAISVLSGILTATNLVGGNVVTQFSITNTPLIGFALSNSQIQVTSNSVSMGSPVSVTRPPTWQLAIAKQNAGVVTTDFATYSI